MGSGSAVLRIVGMGSRSGSKSLWPCFDVCWTSRGEGVDILRRREKSSGSASCGGREMISWGDMLDFLGDAEGREGAGFGDRSIRAGGGGVGRGRSDLSLGLLFLLDLSVRRRERVKNDARSGPPT